MKFKSLLFTAFLGLVLTTTASAQFELKTNPIGMLFSRPELAIEYGVGPSFGLEGTLLLNLGKYQIDGSNYDLDKSTNMILRGKYYLKPDAGIDRWYTGVYTKYQKGKGKAFDSSNYRQDIKTSRFAIGFLLGYKWVSKHNVAFELNAGLGRIIMANVHYSDVRGTKQDETGTLKLDGIGTITIGYRF